MPGAFRDAFDRAAVRRFVGPFVQPTQRIELSFGRKAREFNISIAETVTDAPAGADAIANSTSGTISEECQLSSTLSNDVAKAGQCSVMEGESGAKETAAKASEIKVGEAEENQGTESSPQTFFSAQELHGMATGKTTSEELLRLRAEKAAEKAAAAEAARRRERRKRRREIMEKEAEPEEIAMTRRGIGGGGSGMGGSVVVEEAVANRGGAGSVAVYARDWRELGRWVPRDASFVVGRYMFEVRGVEQRKALQSNASSMHGLFGSIDSLIH